MKNYFKAPYCVSAACIDSIPSRERGKSGLRVSPPL